MYSYLTSGTCARKINFDIIDGKLHNVTFEGGCPGNLKALGILVEGADAREIAGKLHGVTCGSKSTSCSDQLARAISERL